MNRMIPGPPRYSDLTEVAIAYINRLEERIHTLEHYPIPAPASVESTNELLEQIEALSVANKSLCKDLLDAQNRLYAKENS